MRALFGFFCNWIAEKYNIPYIYVEWIFLTLIYGIYIEGARWLTGEDAGDIDDVTGVPTQGYLAPSRLKELLPKVPVIYMKAVVVEPQWEPSSVGYMRHNPAVYDTPVYMTTFRKFTNKIFIGILCNVLYVHQFLF